MTSYINPTYQNPSKNDLQTLFDEHKDDILKSLNCVRPGVIQDFNPANCTATIRISQQQVTSILPDGTETLAEFPLLLQVPIYAMGGGGVTITMPIAAGDECIILFNDRQLDNWKIAGAGLPPTISRSHDFSDAIALVGLRSFPRSLGSYSTTEAQIRTDDGTTWLGINPTTFGIRVQGGTVYEWACHGYGQKIEWTGGSNYTITNYTTGAIVTTITQPIHPPAIP